MLSLTVKTMDSQSRQFQVPDPIRIKDFKDTIASTVNVSAGNQRLIYQGRVLQDDFELTQEHNGKVLHLVQRLPIVTTTGTTSNSTVPTTNGSSSNTSSNGPFNPSHLSHMIFQQAMSGLGNLLVGGSISGNMVQNPSNPSEQIMNIQIDLNGSGANARTTVSSSSSSSSSVTASSTTTTSTSTSTANSQGFRINSFGRSNDQRSSSCSAPRMLLHSVDRNLTQLNNVLDQLEALSAADSATPATSLQDTSIRGVDSSGDVFVSELDQNERADEAMDVTASSLDESNSPAAPSQPQSSDVNRNSAPVSTTAVTSSGSQTSASTHPSLGELGTRYTRLQQARRRLDPFTSQMITFLNTDPSFSSTQTPDYQNAARFLGLSLQAQQLMAEVQRLLSRAVIPLGRTPPRTMLVRAPHVGPHQHHRVHADARRLHHAVHADRVSRAPFFAPPRPSGGSYFSPIRPSSGSFFPSRPSNGSLHRSSSSATSIPLAGSIRQRLFPGGGMRVRWRIPPPSTTNSAPSSGESEPSTTISTTTSTTVSNSSQPAAPQPSPARPPGSGPATVFTVQPPTYTVHVNATIQPHIMFNVGVNPSSAAGTQTTATTTTSASSSASQNQNRTQSGQSGAQQNTFSWPTSGTIPNIPGMQTGALSDLFQSIARSTLQQGSGAAGNTSSVGGGGVILLQGSPDSENQVSEDISNIIGQTVFEAVYNQLTSTSNGDPSLQSNLPNVRVVLTNSTSTTALSSATTTTTWSSSAPSAPTVQTSSNASSPSTAEEFHDAMNVDDVSASRLRQTANDKSKSSKDNLNDEGTSKRDDRQPAPQLNDLLQQLTESLVMRGFDWDQSLFDLLPSDVRDSASQSTSDDREDFFRILLVEISRRFPCRQIISALQGRSEMLTLLRDVVRDVTVRNYFSGSNPTPEQLQTLAGFISERTREFTSDFFADARSFPDVDIVESNLSLMRHTIKKAFELIFFADDSVFASEFGKHARYWASMWSNLNHNVVRGGRKELVKLLKKCKTGVAHRLLRAIEEVCKQSDGTSPLEFFFGMIASLYSGSQNEIDQFVLSEAPTQVDSDTNVASDDAETTENMETSMTSTEKKNSNVERDSAPHSSAGPIDSITDSAESSGSNWKKSVPEEWVETITADGEAQKNMEPQLPFSDAYIAGMPASKRRKVVS